MKLLKQQEDAFHLQQAEKRAKERQGLVVRGKCNYDTL